MDKEPITEYPVGSYVLLTYSHKDDPQLLSKHRPNKFAYNYKGPMRIVNKIGSRYTIRDLVTNKTQTVHISRLRPFYYDPRIIDPRKIARDSNDEYDIESILDIQGSLKRKRYIKSDLKFLVKWKGYDDSYNTWEPYKALKETRQLHTYLNNNNLEYLIPMKYSKEQNSDSDDN